MTRGGWLGNSNSVISGNDASGNLMFAPKPPPPPTPIQSQYNLYNSGVAQDASDRSGIMQGYKDLMGKAPSYLPMMGGGSYTPAQSQYTQSADLKDATSNLASLSKFGGYSDQNVQDMRARSVSPIRAIYANALREVDRNKRLQGGFSPNYNATRAKMAREMSAQIGDASQNVEGDLAAKQAAGRLQVAPTYANLTGSSNAQENEINQRNTDAQNQAAQFNLQLPMQQGNYNLDVFKSMLAPLQGMSSMYGTTPALSNLFGTQALNHAQLQNTMDQQQETNGLNLVGQAMNRGRLG